MTKRRLNPLFEDTAQNVKIGAYYDLESTSCRSCDKPLDDTMSFDVNGVDICLECWMDLTIGAIDNWDTSNGKHLVLRAILDFVHTVDGNPLVQLVHEAFHKGHEDKISWPEFKESMTLTRKPKA